MNRKWIIIAFLLLSVAWSAESAPGSDAVIDGGFSTGTFGGGTTKYFKYWETVGSTWPMWNWELYDTTGDGIKDYCFRFIPKTGRECRLYQDLYLIEGKIYEISMDIALFNS
ncbi:MAG: hypothetical protein ABIK28_09865 [Planctomycetota bacterium]